MSIDHALLRIIRVALDTAELEHIHRAVMINRRLFSIIRTCHVNTSVKAVI